MVKACAMQPHHADWYVCIGIAHADQNRHEESRFPTFARPSPLTRNGGPAHEKLHESLQKLGRWEESRLAWRQLLDLNPPDQIAWDGYAELCLYLGHQDEYRRVRTEMLKRFGDANDPRVAEPHGTCLFVLAAVGR